MRVLNFVLLCRSTEIVNISTCIKVQTTMEYALDFKPLSLTMLLHSYVTGSDSFLGIVDKKSL